MSLELSGEIKCPKCLRKITLKTILDKKRVEDQFEGDLWREFHLSELTHENVSPPLDRVIEYRLICPKCETVVLKVAL
jgi:hypothetical protein